MTRRLSLLILMLSGLMLLSVGQSIAQDDTPAEPAGRGVITIEPTSDDGFIGALNPIACRLTDCETLTDLMFPTLYAVDPATGLAIEAAPGNYGLVAEIAPTTDPVQTIRLRDDLTWTDGTPITAYDVFYSYMGMISGFGTFGRAERINRQISGMRVLDDYTLEVGLRQPDCTVPNNMNMPVVPHHVFDPELRETIADFGGLEDIEQHTLFWFDRVYRLARLSVLDFNEFNDNPTVTAGNYVFDSADLPRYTRLRTNIGAQSLQFAQQTEPISPVQNFLNGDTNILLNPPLEERANLLAAPDVQVAQYPGPFMYAINLNLAAPNDPQDAFDENGDPVEQAPHPIFGDMRVRRALQLALDVPELIDAAYQGYGTQVAANQHPASWAYDETLAPIETDLFEAARLLTEAGWRDTNGNGLRECVNCLYARPGTLLAFELRHAGEDERLALLIARQLGAVGIDILPSGAGIEEVRAVARNQTYSAYLERLDTAFPIDPDQSALFSREADVVGSGTNTGSYYNPEVEALMQEARTLPDCDVQRRAELYHEIQAILQADQPYIWLFAPDDMIVASGGVLGFDPYPQQPFWNVRDWVVVR